MTVHWHNSTGLLHIPEVFLHRLQNPTQDHFLTHRWFGFSICESEIPPSSLILLRVYSSPPHTLTLFLFVGLNSVSWYFSSTWSMTCSTINLFTIMPGSFPQIVGSTFLSKRSEMWALTAGSGCRAKCLVWCFVSFQSTILRSRWPIKFGFQGQKIHAFWLLPAGLTKEKKSKETEIGAKNYCHGTPFVIERMPSIPADRKSVV